MISNYSSNATKSLTLILVATLILFNQTYIHASQGIDKDTLKPSFMQPVNSPNKINFMPLEKFSEMADLAALNICYSLLSKIDYNKSATVSISALSKMINERYGGKVQNMPQNLFSQQLFSRWIASILIVKTSIICPARLPKQIQEEADSIIKNRK